MISFRSSVAGLFAIACSFAPFAQEGPSPEPAPLPEATPSSLPTSPTSAPTAEDLPLEDIRVFVEIFHKVKKDYVEEISDKQLLEDAIKGMLAGLDPHSSYLDAEAYDELQQGTIGEFGGLGIEVGTDDGLIKVIAPIDDTPASRGGILAGDTIIRIDDSPVRGMASNDAIKKMRGKVGSKIKLTLVREGSAKPLEITLVRDLIKIKSVRSRMLEPGFGYVRISAFQGHTGEDLISELAKLKADAGMLKGLVLDLRNNPGGLLGAAVSVSDAFLDTGKIVYTEGRVNDAKLQFDAKPPDLIDGAPLIVLVNEGSASASEIVAGALQDRQRAVIMGRQTFGKGSVQTILPMNNKAAIKITTARYFTPSGRSIQAEGIKPDILIEKVRIEATENAEDSAVTEALLSRHLDNPTKGSDKSASPTPPPAAELVATDYEVYEALNMLKGMVLLHARSSASK
ncbi:MAG: S41 family peptidase [Gammaproteobacteria bacterium]|nr:S41 family peptidase [Gammaproteobacteria bacterium]